MQPDALLSPLINLGTGGAVIFALIHFWRMKEQSEKFLIDRIDKIVDRHLAAEEANRAQIRELSAQNRDLFDRVIAICGDLSLAVHDLRDQMRLGEAITQKLLALGEANQRDIDQIKAELQRRKAGA